MRSTTSGGDTETGVTAGGPSNVFGQLLTLLVAEKAGLSFQPEPDAVQELEDYATAQEERTAEDLTEHATPDLPAER